IGAASCAVVSEPDGSYPALRPHRLPGRHAADRGGVAGCEFAAGAAGRRSRPTLRFALRLTAEFGLPVPNRVLGFETDFVRCRPTTNAISVTAKAEAEQTHTLRMPPPQFVTHRPEPETANKKGLPADTFAGRPKTTTSWGSIERANQTKESSELPGDRSLQPSESRPVRSSPMYRASPSRVCRYVYPTHPSRAALL